MKKKEDNYYNIIGILVFVNDDYNVIRLNIKVITRTNQNFIYHHYLYLNY